jgi:hypothetical protein
MKTIYPIFHLAKADFFERIRQYSFLLVLATIVLIGYLFVPPVGAGYRVLQVGTQRGIYNSAWIGLMFGLTAAMHLPITSIRFGVLIVPIWLMGLPMLAIAAALAVLFECVPFLKGGLGNVIYFFIWLATIGFVITGSVDEATGLAGATRDPYGYTRQLFDIQEQVLLENPDAEVSSSFINSGSDIERTFIWNGIHWPARVVLDRLLWFGLAVVIVGLSAIPFDRFDPAQSKLRPQRESLSHRLVHRFSSFWSVDLLHRKLEEEDGSQVTSAAQLTSMTAKHNQWRFFEVLLAELKLMLKGRSLFWYVGAIGLIIACIAWPLDDVRRYLVIILLLWPITIWSGMGNRERRFQTDQIIFSVAHPLRRQLSATWIAGFIIALIISGCITAIQVINGQGYAIVTWVAGALFIPSLAIALGVWSGGPRLFELVYILWWYIGPVEGVPVFDFIGVTHKTIQTGVPIYYLIASILLFLIAIIGRRRYFEDSII